MRKRKKPGNLNPEEDFYDSMPRVMVAIASGHFPSPPARELYFVAKGKPESALDPLSSIAFHINIYIRTHEQSRISSIDAQQ
ncbi:MAG: hypothetical protein Q7J65_07770, partial [Candidatus Marinimicrobia bacterium]|nr:hypothetical protein [Candidatus Neomarinimicrobiota bacterium]